MTTSAGVFARPNSALDSKEVGYPCGVSRGALNFALPRTHFFITSCHELLSWNI